MQRWREAIARIERIEHQQVENERLLDALFSDARYLPGEDVGLNGQQGRKELVKDLLARFRASLIVETGTHFGATTGYLATEYGLPVHTCEVTPRYFHVARHLLRDLAAVTVHQLDSRALLRELGAAADHRAQRVFFYLDAHWHEDLPLAEEVDVIASQWAEWVAVVDDFAVPGDPGYGFDDYGGDQQLTIDYVAPVLRRHGLPAFFPSRPSSDETGARRGCLVTCSAESAADVATSPYLRRHDFS